jgi:hypothetical protein
MIKQFPYVFSCLIYWNTSAICLDATSRSGIFLSINFSDCLEVKEVEEGELSEEISDRNVSVKQPQVNCLPAIGKLWVSIGN